MQPSGRDLLAAGATAFTTGLAGCSASNGGGEESAGTATGTSTATAESGSNGSTDSTATAPSVGTAVAAEWNAVWTRLWDALALGIAGEIGTHQYCCIPHEAAGMVGTVTVE